jgi:hypothetical protein
VSEDIEKRIAEAKAKRAQLQAEADARAAERELAEQLETEERGVRDLEAIKKAEADHGAMGKKIAVVQTDLGAVVLRRANPLHYRRFLNEGPITEAGSLKLDVAEKLVRSCLVYPALSTFEAWLEEQPLILVSCATALGQLAGSRAKEVEGKS